MHRFTLLCALLSATLLAAPAAPDLSKPQPSIALSDGRILKNATFTTFKAENVTIRHAGGVAVLRYEFLPADLRAAAEAKRPGGPRVPVAEVATKTVTLKGQVFVETRGAGAYKFPGVPVYAFDHEHLSAWDSRANPVRLPFPIATTTTDADGRFVIAVPAERPYFLFAQASRRLPGGTVEQNEWRLSSEHIKKPDEVMLNGALATNYRPVQIEKQP